MYTPLATIEEFGKQLLDSKDLDSMYCAVYGAKFDPDHLRRWTFAYCCVYNAGVASWASEQNDFWGAMAIVAANETQSPIGGRWARGPERRHFRGQKAIDAIEKISKQYPSVEKLMERFEGAGKFDRLRKMVVELPQFGPMLAFKIADMIERVGGHKIDFSNSEVLMYDMPFESALHEGAQRNMKPNEVVEYLIDYFKGCLAPPSYNRPVNIQEVETMLCKYKSHRNGSYPLLLDIKELHAELAKWSDVCETAKVIKEKAPTYGH